MFYLVTSVFSKLNSSHDLLVNEISGNSVFTRLVPRSEDFFAEKQPPGGVPLLGSLLLGVLFALANGVHDVVTSTSERRDFVVEGDIQGETECVGERYFVGQLET